MISVKRRRLSIVIAASLVLAVACLRSAGSWLIVEDPLQPAGAIVVFGGQVPFRAMEAARTYHQGWAREVWLTQSAASDEDVALDKLGIERPSDSEISRRVVERLGVPASAVRMLPERIVNTAEEVRAIGREVQQAGGDRVILITS